MGTFSNIFKGEISFLGNVKGDEILSENIMAYLVAFTESKNGITRMNNTSKGEK
jgi:hypothetical protein